MDWLFWFSFLSILSAFFDLLQLPWKLAENNKECEGEYILLMKLILAVINLSVYFLWVLFSLLFQKDVISVLPASSALRLGDA